MNWFKRRPNTASIKQQKYGLQHGEERNWQRPIVEAIDRVADQIKAETIEEKKEDAGKTIREMVTIALIFCAFIASFVGDVIFYFTMVDNKNAAETQHKDTLSQLKILENQLSATSTQASAEAASVQAFINSERGQLFIGSMTLNKVNDNDPNPTVQFSFVNMGHSAVVIDKVLTYCTVVWSWAIPTIPDFTPAKVNEGEFSIGSDASFGTPNTGSTNSNLTSCSFPAVVTADDWTRISGGAEYLLLYARVQYRDDFRAYTSDFGGIYGGQDKGFTTSGLSSSFNQENQAN